ncbi:MAG TPA: hypothetical protein VIL09_03650 [Microvirga sp.]|jgi:hypothetical protein
MQFQYTPKYASRAPSGPFTLDRVWAHDGTDEREVSQLLDRTYRYRSARELQWHLADRFGFKAQAIGLSQR